MVALFAVMLVPITAYPHHFKGLPHFNYFENYPQIPQDEYLWQEGDYEFSLVIYDFQGIEKTDANQPNDARLYLVIWSLRENRIYNQELIVRILDHEEPIHGVRFDAAVEENIYSFQHVLPETGKYSLQVDLADGTVATIPFKLSSQKVPWGKWVGGVLVVLVVIVAIGSRRARVLQDRRELAKARKTSPAS
jgi:hypothetical protein